MKDKIETLHKCSCCGKIKITQKIGPFYNRKHICILCFLEKEK